MSQGLTWIAARRMPLVALVAIFALAVGMFAALQPAHAAPAIGDVTATSGVCTAANADGDPNTINAEDRVVYGEDMAASGPIQVYVEDAIAAADEDPAETGDEAKTDLANVECEDADVGKTIKITPDGTESPIVEPQAQLLTLTLGDSDGIVSDDSTLRITIADKNLIGDSEAMLLYVRVSGEIDHPVASGTVADADDTDAAPGTQVDIVIPDGTTEGEYTVSTRATVPDGDDATGLPDSDALPGEILSASATFTVGDAGTNAAALELALSTSSDDDAKTTANEGADETGSTAASKSIWLKVSATNSLGSAANAGGLNSLSVIAPGGTVEIHAPGPGGSLPRGADSPGADDDAGGSDSASFDDPGSTMYVKIGKKGSPPKPGSVDVYALMIGSDGAPRSETVTLSFTGGAASLTIGEPANISVSKQTEFTVDGADAGGNTAGVGRLTFKVTDADGDAVGQSVVKVEQSTQGAYTDGEDQGGDDNPKQVTGLITSGAKAPAGTYTITVSLVGVDDSEATAELTIVGKTADVAVSASATESSTIGDIITVTADLIDEDGNGAPDGTSVDFSVSANTGLSAIGSRHANDSEDEGGPRTKDGAASVKFAVVGSGISVVSATSGGVSNCRGYPQHCRHGRRG